MLDLDMSAVEWMMKCFPEVKELEDMRRAIGKFALTGKQQVSFFDLRAAFHGVSPA